MRIWIQSIKTIAIAAFAFGASTLSAQDAAPPAVETIKVLDPDEVLEAFSIVEQPIEATLEVLSELTGRSILRPQALPTPQITFDSNGPITRRELVLAFQSLLSLNDIGISPLGERFLKVVPVSEMRSEAPELVTESLAGRDASGQVVSKLFRLQHLDSQTFQQQIQPFLSPGFSTIIPFQNSNAVIVTDTVSNLQRLEYVVGEVDKPSRLNIEPAFFTLEYAQASEVAQQIQSMIEDARSRFGSQNGQQNNNSLERRPRRRRDAEEAEGPAAPVGAEAGGIGQILFGSNTAITSDERTNQIIIMTAPANLAFFKDIIKKLDIKADPSTRIEVIPLKHADATEVSSLLSQFVSSGTGNTGNDRSASNQNSRRNNAGTPTFGNNRNNNNNGNARNENANTAANRGPAGIAASAEDRDSQFSSFMTIQPDERSNSLVIAGTRSDLELMSLLVEKIDVLLPQVRIEVIIAEVTLNHNEGITRGTDAFGFRYTDFPGEDGGRFETGLDGLPGLNILGVALGGTVDYANGKTSNLTLNTIFNTARTNNNVSLLSVPTLVTTHNKEATILVGESRPIVTGSQSSTVGDTFRQSVQYQDIGIELTVTPLIGPNDVIQLEIDQSIDDVSGSVEIDGNAQPIIGRRQATSYISVANRELVILGGLQRSRAEKRKNKAAIIGEIPVLGNLFTRRGKEKVKTELLVFIRPEVIRTTDDVNRDANAKLLKLHGGKDISEFLKNGNVDVEIHDLNDEQKEEE